MPYLSGKTEKLGIGPWGGGDWYHLEYSEKVVACRHCLLILPYSQKFSLGENFRQFRHLLLLAKFLSVNILSWVNDYIEGMATFTALAKIYSTKYFCNTKVAEHGEILVQ